MSGEEEEEEKVSKVQCRHAPKVRAEKKEGFCKVSKVKSLVSSEQKSKFLEQLVGSNRVRTKSQSQSQPGAGERKG